MALLSPLPSLDSSSSNGFDALQSLGDALTTPVTASTTTPASSSSSSPLSGWLGSNNPLSQFLSNSGSNIQNLLSGVTGSGSSSNSAPAISWSRVAAFTVGILLIGGGILMFRQTQTIIQTGIKHGRRIAEVAAL